MTKYVEPWPDSLSGPLSLNETEDVITSKQARVIGRDRGGEHL